MSTSTAGRHDPACARHRAPRLNFRARRHRAISAQARKDITVIQRIFGNWQTTLAAVVILVVSGFDSFVYDLPQWSLAFSDALPVAFGLLLAKDAATGSQPGAAG
jgi:hypothetical protein